MTSKEARESILEIQVNAALSGHDLGPFEPSSWHCSPGVKWVAKREGILLLAIQANDIVMGNDVVI